MISTTISDGLAVVAMDDGRANAINGPLLQALGRALDEAEGAGAGALVLAGRPRFFSAGLDLPALLALPRPGMEEFWDLFCATLSRLFAHPRPVVAAMTGHAVAGGCILAMQADYRVLAQGSYRCGMNEFALGVAVPSLVTETFRGALPPEAYWRVVMTGEIFDPEGARDVGLVQEIAAESEVLDAARAQARRLAAIPGRAFAETKRLARRPALAAMAAEAREDARRWLDIWFAPETQEKLQATAGRLSARRT